MFCFSYSNCCIVSEHNVIAQFFKPCADFYLQYFGGTNFGRTAGGPLVATSYDYDAPIDEYGKPFDNGYTHLSQFM
jgi:hypothetical protein